MREPFLNMGITCATFSFSGWIPVRKDILTMCANGFAISNFISWSIWFGILSGPVLLLGLNCDMTSMISVWLVGKKSSILAIGDGSFRNSEKFLFPSYFLSLRILSAISEK